MVNYLRGYSQIDRTNHEDHIRFNTPSISVALGLSRLSLRAKFPLSIESKEDPNTGQKTYYGEWMPLAMFDDVIEKGNFFHARLHGELHEIEDRGQSNPYMLYSFRTEDRKPFMINNILVASI